jgi:hypothetical protein
MPKPRTWLTPGMVYTIRHFCRNEVKCGNMQIRQMVFEQFDVLLTPGQISGLFNPGNPLSDVIRGYAGRVGNKRPDAETILARRKERRVSAKLKIEDTVPMAKASEPPPDPVASAAHDRRMAIPTVDPRPPMTPQQHTRRVILAKATLRATRQATLPALATSTSSGPATAVGVEQIPLAPPVAIIPPKYGRITECSWPIGEPRTSEFRYCDDPSLAGRSYCEAHCKMAYAGTPARRGIMSQAQLNYHFPSPESL